MNKILSPILKAVPALVSLFRSHTSEEGKGIVKSGVASLTIAGLISSGRVSASGVDSTLLIILAILEAAGYLYGFVALSAGSAQVDPEQSLLEGKVDGLAPEQAKTLGREWIRMKQQKQIQDMDPHSARIPEGRDLSEFN